VDGVLFYVGFFQFAYRVTDKAKEFREGMQRALSLLPKLNQYKYQRDLNRKYGELMIKSMPVVGMK
jgi:hypothetical protein